VGKGTVVRRLRALRPDLAYSISATTRRPRPGERDGVDYHFISGADFDRLIGEGAFLEWAVIYDHHRSGTLLGPVAEAIGSGRDMILELDVQGATAVRRRFPDALLVFLAPPSEEELARRLRKRRTENERETARRLAAAVSEMEQVASFDHIVVNDDVDAAAAQVAAIIDANRSSP
jgi:guanylate kinase